ncbi:hypothetical protein [Wukongibacter sp. M2B1]
MCDKCKEEIKKKTCTRCGDTIEKHDFEKNNKFDIDNFKALSRE